MIRPIQLVLILALTSGCAHFGGLGSTAEERSDLWSSAQAELAAQQFSRAEVLFNRLAREHASTVEGRESLFYLGAIRMDPRNPGWDSEVAQARLDEYLAFIGDGRGPRLYRYPEAISLRELARQLNLPPDSRVAGLQPEERVVTIEERVVVPAEQSRELLAEVQQLRQQVAERDSRIRQLQEEIERIRRTLTAPARSQ